MKIKKKLGDKKGEAVSQDQLGTIAMLRGNLEEALKRHTRSQQVFQGLNEPSGVATTWHQIGRIQHLDLRLDDAEKAYRRAAQIIESL